MKNRLFTLFVALVASVSIQISAMQFWPVIMDGTTINANASSMVASFAPNEIDQFLYIWENTYSAGTATGLNFNGNGDGYTALVVADKGWSGLGFSLTDKGNGWQAAEQLRQAIVANPDNYFLHLAIKSTDEASHCFYIFGSEATKFVLGNHSEYDGTVYDDFDRDGEWHDFFIPMTKYASLLANTVVTAGVNVFVTLSQGMAGAQLNLDAVYFCDSEFANMVPVVKGKYDVKYEGNEGDELYNESVTLHVPVAPEIEGFTFVEWQVAEGKLADGIVLQAVYKANQPKEDSVNEVMTSAPARKLIRNGNVFIMRDDKAFTVQGQQVK